MPSAHTLPLQQPAHEVPSHTHAPAAQCCPGAQLAAPPQRHSPPEHPSARVASQVRHAPPIGPQLVAAIGEHTSPSQQPDVHDEASHTHRPEAHRCPGRHDGPTPQPHAPADEHASARTGSHATQLAPAVPQLARARSWQSAPSQHPDGHDDASQMHRPAMHRCPGTHVAESPQLHVPSAAHPSERDASQTRHAAPGGPHAMGERAEHVAPEQHPLGQLAASHPLQAPAVQLSPSGHGAQARPALPHALASLPARQVSASQQPVGHESASQTQRSASQRWPTPHAGPAPHPCVHRDATPAIDAQLQPASMRQLSLQPSPGTTLPSSQSSIHSRTSPSPQTASGPR